VDQAIEKFYTQDFSLQSQSPIPSNISEGVYSETRYSDTISSTHSDSPLPESPALIESPRPDQLNFNLNEIDFDQLTYSANNTSDSEESTKENLNMADMNAVVAALGHLTAALTAQNG
jgi:hypothetical protein